MKKTTFAQRMWVNSTGDFRSGQKYLSDLNRESFDKITIN